MSVTVLLFASYADLVGAPNICVDLPEQSTVRELLVALQRDARTARLPATPVVAVNQRYANASTPITAGDEVALIPPVAGG